MYIERKSRVTKDNKPKKSKLLELYDNKLLRGKVDFMIDDGKSLSYLVQFCSTHGFSISTGSMKNYKDKRAEAIKTNVPLEQLLDRRVAVKGTVVDIRSKEVNVAPANEGDVDSKEPVSGERQLNNIIQPLEELIKTGWETMEHINVVDMPLMLKSIELYAKITGNTGGGVTTAGLHQIRLRQVAMESALTEVILSHIPEEKHEQVFEEIAETAEAFYANLDLSEEGKAVKETLQRANVKL